MIQQIASEAFLSSRSREAGLRFWTLSERPQGTSVRFCDARTAAQDGAVSSRPAFPSSPPSLSGPPQSPLPHRQGEGDTHAHRNAWLIPLTSKDKAGFPNN